MYLDFLAEEDEQEVVPLWIVEKTLPMQLMAFAWLEKFKLVK